MPPLGIFGLEPGIDALEKHPLAKPMDPFYDPAKPTPERVDELRAMPYDEYLQSEEWRHRRRWILHRAESRCEQCGSRREPLHVHHLTYERLGDEHDDDLLVLCARCHLDIHDHAWR
jgi:hypothetical protein